MKKYIIEEVIEFECSNDGELTTQFRLEGDPDESYRQIVIDENYYYFAEDICKEEGIDIDGAEPVAAETPPA